MKVASYVSRCRRTWRAEIEDKIAGGGQRLLQDFLLRLIASQSALVSALVQ